MCVFCSPEVACLGMTTDDTSNDSPDVDSISPMAEVKKGMMLFSVEHSDVLNVDNEYGPRVDLIALLFFTNSVSELLALEFVTPTCLY